MKKTLTVFPKPATFIKPSESAFHDPTLREKHESMKFIPFYNFHFRSGDGFDCIRELFSGISSIDHDFL